MANSEASNNDETYRHGGIGLLVAPPIPGWKRSIDPQDNAIRLTFHDTERQIVLTFWEAAGPARTLHLRDEELKRWAGSRDAVKEISKGDRAVAGKFSSFIRYRLASDGRDYVIDSCYFGHEGIVYHLMASVPAKAANDLDNLVSAAGKAISWTTPKIEKAVEESGPLHIESPEAGHVATLVSAEGEEAPYRYLEALPGAAIANGGRPVVLLVGGALGQPARSFLKKFRPHRIRTFGKPVAGVSNTETASEPWPEGGTVVVAERSLSRAIPAAALATQLKVPLIVAGPDLGERLAMLRPQKVLVVGEAAVPFGLAQEQLSDCASVARAAGGGRYVALCNVAEGKDQAAAIFAAALAASHDGAVLCMDRPVRCHSAALKIVDQAPPGLPASPTGRYGVGAIPVAGLSLLVAAPIMGTLQLKLHPDSPWFGRPRIDLDGDGALKDGREEPAIGATVAVAGKRFQFTAKFASPMGSATRERESESLIQLLEPAPSDLREEIQAFVRELGGADHLALVGGTERIPFDRVECKSYFNNYAMQQEIATDATYGRLDDASPCGMAVGRLLPDGLENGSVHIATALAYPQLTGQWRERAAIIQPGYARHEVEAGYQWVIPEAEALLRAVAQDLEGVGIACDRFFREKVDDQKAVASLAKAGWVCFQNHADQESWAIHPKSKIVPAWTGRLRDKPPAGTHVLPELEGAPIVYSGGCLSAGIDLGIPGPCYPERFFQLGAAAYIGNTRSASVGSEYTIKEFFNALLYRGATLGEALREGRNFLAHLLGAGHMDPRVDGWLTDPFYYDLLWEQYYNMNLFGDPALRPRMPANPGQAPVLVHLEVPEPQRGRARLTIQRTAEERIDSIWIMPALGKGRPREAYIRTAPGFTFSEVPQAFLIPHYGLVPIRSNPSVPPGAWVNVELPSGARNVSLKLAEGPDWANRGFAVQRGIRGEPRLQLFVPLTRSTLEAAAGEAVERVVFDMTFDLEPGSAFVPQNEPRVIDEPRWEEKPCKAPGVVSQEARRILEQVRGRAPDPVRQGLEAAELTISLPDSRVFRDSRFLIDWTKGSKPLAKAVNLPAAFEARRATIESGMSRFVEFFLTGKPGEAEDWLGYHVDVDWKGNSETILRLIPAETREGQETMRLHISKRFEPTRYRSWRFGVSDEWRYEYRESDDGLALVDKITIADVGMATGVIHYEYKKHEGLYLPVQVQLDLPGYIAKSLRYSITYGRLSRKL